MTDSEDEITDLDADVKRRSPTSERRKLRAMSKSLVVAPETISLSGALKRGLKLGPTDDADGRSLSNTLRRELKSSVTNLAGSLPRGATMQPVHADEGPASPRPGGKFFSTRKPRKSEESALQKSPRHKSGRTSRDRKKSEYACDDSISMLEDVLVDSQGIRYEEGIRDSIGRKMKVTLKKMVKLEKSQGGAADMKVLTLTPDRCFILGVKSPFKVEVNFHFLDIKSIDSPTTDRLTISTTNGKIFFFQMIGSDDADQIIGRVALSLRKTFPGVSLSKIVKASLEPLSRQKVIQSMLNQADLMESGPCGNFSEMYQCMCNHMGLPVREEVGWDVDTIYLSQNCKELNLKDFDLPDLKDYVPIVSVLRFNRWFEGLTVRNIKLTNDVFDAILKVVQCSVHLKSLILDGVGLKGETACKLSQELVDNKESHVNFLDLSNNPLEDRAIMHLSNSMPGLRRGGGLQVLKFDRTGLTAKGVSGLCQALRSSAKITKSLTYLSLSDNSIKGDEAGGLYNYLSTPNNLEHLDMSGTDCAVEIYVSAMSKGCLEKLKTINLSRNFFYGKGISARPPHYIEEEYTGNSLSKIVSKKNKENALPNTFQQYFKTTKALASIDLSGMKVPHEAVKQLMDGLRHNFTEGLAVSVNLSNGEIRAQGAQVIGAVIGQLSNLVGLDLTDNGLDADLAKLLAWVQQNKSLRELKIGKNFNGIKPKHMRAVIDSIVELVQEEGSCLESLHLNDSRLKDWATVILGCLGSNTSLQTLDISGNLIGDSGARVLAKALQINSKIRVLLMDRNSFTANGFHEIASALEKNYSLRYLPYPVNDAVAAMKSQPDRTQASLAKIQDLLLRNANLNKNSNDQQFRLQQAVASTAQEVLDKVAEKVDNTVNALDLLEDPTSCHEVVVKAKGLVKDANMSKHLLSDIYGLGMEMTAGDQSNLKLKLNEMAREMDEMVQEHVKNTVSAMTKSAESQCPHIFQDIIRDVEGKSAEKSTFPRDFVKDRVITEASKEIINKVSELNLAVATLISEKVADTLLTALSQCNTTLTEQLKKKKEEQAAAREKLYLKNENESKAKKAASEKPTPSDDVAEPTIKEPSKDEKKAASTENILPAMRKARAASIAKRKQRPNQSLDLEPKKKADEQPAAPRPATPVQESESSDEEAPPDRSPEDAKITTQEGVIEEKEINKEKPVEEEQREDETTEEVPQEKVEEKTPEPEEETPEESPKEDIVADKEEESDDMVAVDSVKETKIDDIHDGGVSADELDFLPELPAATRKLEHVTKGRARPVRRTQRKPAAKDTDSDQSVDDFFTASVTSTDFDKVPTLDEQKKESEKEKEKTPRKPRGFGLPGMGQITPDMLKKRRQNSGNSDKDEHKEENKSADEREEHKSKNGEEEETETVTKRRPPGAMGLPGMGMGFGGNVLAEMKLKKLNKSKNAESTEDGKPDSEQSTASPFGRGMLKKTVRSPTSPTAKKEDANSNNNNNKAAVKSTPNRWKSKSFEKEKPDISPKPSVSKGPALPQKPSPPPLSAKPGKGSPPPLPSKPKPTARPDSVLRGARSRPVSEFVDPKRVPASIKDRVSSWGKKPEK